MVTIQDNVNRIFEDDDFLRIFDKTLKDNQISNAKNKWNYNEFDNNVNIKSLNVPVEDQIDGYTYTYVEDYKTAKKIIDDLNKYLKNSGFTVDNKYVNTNIDPNEDYEPIGKMVNKFLETAGIHAFIKDKSSSKNERIYITVGMNCINVDAPEFKDYYQPDKFTVYLDTNIIFKIQKYVKSTQELRQSILSNVRTIIEKDINQNWQFIDFTEKEQD